MRVTKKGQVTIPKHIREAAGMLPGSDVTLSQEGDRIIITKKSGNVVDDRRARSELVSDKAASSMSPEFRHLSAEEVVAILRPIDDYVG